MNGSEQLGPFYYGTDYGSCCYFSGQANLEKWPEGTNSVKVRKCHCGVAYVISSTTNERVFSNRGTMVSRKELEMETKMASLSS